MNIDILQHKRDNSWWPITTDIFESSYCTCPECEYTVRIYGHHYEGAIVRCPHDDCKSWFVLGEQDYNHLEWWKKWLYQKGGPRVIFEGDME